MPCRLAPLLALSLVAVPMGGASAKRHPVQHTIQPRAAVHYYRAKHPHPTFTLAPSRPQLADG